MRKTSAEAWAELKADPVRKAHNLEVKRLWRESHREVLNSAERKRLSEQTPVEKAHRVATALHWNKANPERVKKTNRAWYAKIKANTIAHYGGMCVCCGEDNPMFLTMDHVKNDGAAHRKGDGRGKSLWWWAFKHGYPDSLQLMCYNCNCAKGHLGYCPHEKEDYTLQIGIG